MNCPVCIEERLVIADRQGIEIDYCPKCRGIWLDRGELDKLIERSTTTMAPAAAADYREPRSADRRSTYDDPPKKKRSSFLGEIFDI